MTEQTFQMHVMPSVFVLETTMPQSMIDSVNDYMDEYKEKKDKQSLKHSLVGQIHKGEQLLLDHEDERMIEYNKFVCNLGADYINYFAMLFGKNETIPVEIAIWLPQLIIFLICTLGLTRLNEN